MEVLTREQWLVTLYELPPAHESADYGDEMRERLIAQALKQTTAQEEAVAA
jgi:hypothetical protein